MGVRDLGLLVWAPWSDWYNMPIMILVLAGIVSRTWHQGELCERCIDEWPLNPSAEADRHRRLLWLSHHQYLVLLVWVVAVAGTSLLGGDGHGAVGRAVSSALCITSAISCYAFLKHEGLVPWCPWCRGGGGGGRDTETAPAPDGDRQPAPAA